MDILTAANYVSAIMEQACVYTMKSNITETEIGVNKASEPVMDIINKIESSICPSQCNGNGNCSNQKCSCNSGTE